MNPFPMTLSPVTSSWRDGTCYSIASYSVPDLTQSWFMTVRNYRIPVCVLVRVGRGWSLKLKKVSFLACQSYDSEGTAAVVGSL